MLYTAYTFRTTRVPQMENGVYLTSCDIDHMMSCDIDHVQKSTRLSLHFFYGVKGHSKTLCVKEGEPGNEAKCSQDSKLERVTLGKL